MPYTDLGNGNTRYSDNIAQFAIYETLISYEHTKTDTYLIYFLYTGVPDAFNQV